jgi:chromosomal replication initiator protein
MSTIWEDVKNQLKSDLPQKSFSVWISPIKLLEKKDDTLFLGCPNKFSRNWIVENYLGIIEKKLTELGNGNYKLALKVKAPQKRKAFPENHTDSKQLVLPDTQTKKPFVRRWLNDEFTFDRFVVGGCNEFAYSASKAIALGTDFLYNPLFLLASTGLGKSHLSQAIGNEILDHDPTVRVCYVTAEGFVNEMIYALKNNRIEGFKNKYRRCCDVLLLEEVHFLSGKEKTQLELSYTLDALANERKKLIFTSSLLPRDFPKMSSELSSRLTSGVITTLETPDFKTRIKILQKKAAEQNLSLPEEILHLFAENLTRDVRQLESALRYLKARSELLNATIDMDLAREALKVHVSSQPCTTLKDVETLVCHYFKIDHLVLRSRSRKKIHAYPRNVYIYLCRHHTEATLEAIAKSIDRNHATALYASEVIEHKKKVDNKVKKEVNFLSRKLEDISR